MLARVTAQYLRIFCWHVLRYLRRHPLLGLLNILSVALGVAVYLATQIANQSANRAFAASVDLVAGKADPRVSSSARDLSGTVFPGGAPGAGVFGGTPPGQGGGRVLAFFGGYLGIPGNDVFSRPPF